MEQVIRFYLECNLENVDLCRQDFSSTCAILRRCPLLQTIKAFIGRFTCESPGDLESCGDCAGEMPEDPEACSSSSAILETWSAETSSPGYIRDKSVIYLQKLVLKCNTVITLYGVQNSKQRIPHGHVMEV